MTISENILANISYTLRIDSKNGEIVEEVSNEKPLEIIIGNGQIIPKFELNLYGLKEGETFNFSLKPEDAFGLNNEQAIVDVSKNSFIIDGEMRYDMMQLGKTISMLEKSGRKVTGRVIGISDTHVKLDFNHPLAGKELYFSGTILNVKEPTQEDYNNLNYHSCTFSGDCDCNTEEKETCDCDDSSCGC